MIHLIVMGVSGAGKSTLGAALAAHLSWPFQEGDALHAPANVAKMHAGKPLNDADRAPWLAAIGAWIDERHTTCKSGVITCSALKQAYRDGLRRGRPDVRFVYLSAARELLETRLQLRTGHYMPAALLDSQLATLHAPSTDEAVIVDAALPTAAQVALVVQALVEPQSGNSP